MIRRTWFRLDRHDESTEPDEPVNFRDATPAEVQAEARRLGAVPGRHGTVHLPPLERVDRERLKGELENYNLKRR